MTVEQNLHKPQKDGIQRPSGLVKKGRPGKNEPWRGRGGSEPLPTAHEPLTLSYILCNKMLYELWVSLICSRKLFEREEAVGTSDL